MYADYKKGLTRNLREWKLIRQKGANYPRWAAVKRLGELRATSLEVNTPLIDKELLL